MNIFSIRLVFEKYVSSTRQPFKIFHSVNTKMLPLIAYRYAHYDHSDVKCPIATVYRTPIGDKDAAWGARGQGLNLSNNQIFYTTLALKGSFCQFLWFHSIDLKSIVFINNWICPSLNLNKP